MDGWKIVSWEVFRDNFRGDVGVFGVDFLFFFFVFEYFVY